MKICVDYSDTAANDDIIIVMVIIIIIMVGIIRKACLLRSTAKLN